MKPSEDPLDFGELFEGTNPFTGLLPRPPGGAVHTGDAPAPVGPYSQGVRAGGMLFCSGQVGLDPATGALVEGGVAAQTERALKNLAAVLAAGGSSMRKVVKTTIYLADINDFATVNATYGAFFGQPAPARTTIAVAALPLGARVEIEAIAVLR